MIQVNQVRTTAIWALLAATIGCIGEDGTDGEIGAAGSPGETGEEGAAGALGPQGSQGAQGPQGAQGDPGPAGAVGPTGPSGGGVGDISSVSAGSGLTGGGLAGDIALSIDWTAMSSCVAGSSIRAFNPDGTVICEADDTGGGMGTGDIDAVNTAPGSGLIGGGIQGSLDLAVDFSVFGGCAGTDKVAGVDATTGAVICAPDASGGGGSGDITSVDTAPSSGLLGGASTGAVSLAVDYSVFGTCAGTQKVTGIGPTGAVTCGADQTGGGSGNGVQGYDSPEFSFFEDTLAFGDNYVYNLDISSVTPANNGVCFVTVSAQLRSDLANADDAPFFRLAWNGGSNANDESSGHYPTAEAGAFGLYWSNQSRSAVIPVTGGTTYDFGCFFGDVAGDWVGDYVYCHVAYICL